MLRPVWVIGLLILGLGAWRPLSATPAPDKLKAAYVFNFLKFTTWPTTSHPPGQLQLCLVNANEALRSAFDALNGQEVNGRAILVKSLGKTTEVDECHVYYLRQGGAPVALKNLIEANPGLLTIGDARNFVSSGGMIGLIEEGGRMQFDINLTLLKQVEYRISAQLLKLARNTRMTP